MPIGDDKHKRIFEELVNILGERWVEDDPAIMEAFYHDMSGQSTLNEQRVEFIALPEDTEDVQKIIRLANRLDFPVSISSSGLLMGTCSAVKGYPYWCWIDPKRMNHIVKIDADNMYAIVEPSVTVGELSCEVMKVGLFHGHPGASSVCSVVGTNVFQNVHWTGWRSGVGQNLLGFEWVLPTGEILRTGMLAMPGDKWAWGEGPGPDVRGLMRGHVGHLGAFGVVTKIAVKLHNWPGPRVIPTVGIQPEKLVPLPQDIFKYHAITFPSFLASIQAIEQLGKAEVAGWLMKFSVTDFVLWYARSMELFWEEWNDEFWTKQKEDGHMIALSLWGFAGTKQVEYEEKVVQDVMKEFGGVEHPPEYWKKAEALMNICSVRDTYRHRFTRPGGCGADTGMNAESLYDNLRSWDMGSAYRFSWTPPLMEMGNDTKFWPSNFGRLCTHEQDNYGDRSAEFANLSEIIAPGTFMNELKHGNAGMSQVMMPMNAIGERYHNMHEYVYKIKKALDPNNISNPTRVIDIKAMEAGTAAAFDEGYRYY
jgi:hypothetical protein